MIQAKIQTPKLFSQRALLGIGMTLALSGSLRAQGASVSGKVSDSTGASVPAASVTVKSTETGATRLTITDEGGNFHANALPLGPQEIRVEKAGFKAAVRTGIDLVGQEAAVNFTLEVGESAQSITVSGEADRKSVV